MNEHEYNEFFAQTRIDDAISSVHDSKISHGQLRELQDYLVQVRKELKAPNTNIASTEQALLVLERRLNTQQKWQDWLLKPVIQNVVSNSIFALLGFIAGALLTKYHLFG